MGAEWFDYFRWQCYPLLNKHLLWIINRLLWLRPHWGFRKVTSRVAGHTATPDPLPSAILSCGLPRRLSSKESVCQCRKCKYNPWVRKIPWRRKWQTMPVFLPGKSHGHRSLAGYSPWGHKRTRYDLVAKQFYYRMQVSSMRAGTSSVYYLVQGTQLVC